MRASTGRIARPAASCSTIPTTKTRRPKFAPVASRSPPYFPARRDDTLAANGRCGSHKKFSRLTPFEGRQPRSHFSIGPHAGPSPRQRVEPSGLIRHPSPSMSISRPRDKQLAQLQLSTLLKKQKLDQALNTKEFARLAGISYSQARGWFRKPGFPAVGNAVFWTDFVVWRRLQCGLTAMLEQSKYVRPLTPHLQPSLVAYRKSHSPAKPQDFLPRLADA